MQGADFQYIYSAVNADDTYVISCYAMLLGNVKIEFNSISIDSDGIITIIIGDSETLALDPSVVYYYRIRLESISGAVSFPFEGTMSIIPTITRI